MPDDPGLGEAHRRIDRLETRLDNRVVSLNTYHAEREHDRDEVKALGRELGDMRAEHGADMAKLEGQLKVANERLTNALRLAVTGLLMPILVAIAAWVIQTRG